MKKEIFSILIPALFIGNIWVNGQMENHEMILKSENQDNDFNSLMEYSENLTTYFAFNIHQPVLFSTDSQSKHLKIEFNHPDKKKVKLVIINDDNKVVFAKNLKCKQHVVIGLHKVICPHFMVNVYHDDKLLMASQEITRENLRLP